LSPLGTGSPAALQERSFDGFWSAEKTPTGRSFGTSNQRYAWSFPDQFESSPASPAEKAGHRLFQLTGADSNDGALQLRHILNIRIPKMAQGVSHGRHSLMHGTRSPATGFCNPAAHAAGDARRFHER
jgi:hypothetical protein